MSGGVGALTNRVHDIIRRMGDNLAQAEATKTCYGILAIMSREEASKIIIAKNGIDIILSGMQTHMDKVDLQEAGCDLIWSLAFNNSPVKEMIGNVNGTSVIVRALKRHHKSAEFLKSACGALSNLCQYKVNQQGVASHGGLQPLINAISMHQANAKLLPFVFDALASLIVGNEENARIVSSQEGITKVLAAMTQHKEIAEVVKSGCHALAILSDVKGQASKIAFAGGVMSILPLLDLHPSYADFHRVAAVVLLRMLQESTHVVREITSNEGIRILLKSLDKGGAQQDTVAAITHILSTVTNPLSAATNSIESQLWVPAHEAQPDASATGGRRGRFPRNDARYVLAADAASGSSSPIKPPGARKSATSEVTGLSGLVRLMGQYSERKDVARASCRLLTNLMGYPGVIMALDKISLMDKVFECVNNHRSTKDIMESASALLKTIHKRTFPGFTGSKLSCINGLFHLVRVKMTDDEVVVASIEILNRLVESENHRQRMGGQPSSCSVSQWDAEAVTLCKMIVDAIIAGCSRFATAESGQQLISWSKSTPKLINTILEFLETLCKDRRRDNKIFTVAFVTALQNMVSSIPTRSSDISSRVQSLIPQIQNYLVDGFVSGLDGDRGGGERSPKAETSGRRRSVNTSANTTTSTTNRSITVGDDSAEQALEGNKSSGDNSSNLPKDSSRSSGFASMKSSSWKSGNSSEDGSRSSRSVVESPRDPTAPRHPLKNCDIPSDDNQEPIKRLLDTYPSHLEMLATDSGPGRNSNGINDFDPSSRDSSYYQSQGIPSRMQLVYEGASAAGKGVISKCATAVPYMPPATGVGLPFAHSIKFDSEFESGNLQYAIQKGDTDYDLCLRSDLHTPGHTQWFYFAVSNTHNPDVVSKATANSVPVPPVKVRFNIVNLTKPDSIFNQGMKPVVYSVNSANSKGQGWIRSGSNICYASNPFLRNNSAGEGVACYFTLTFSLEFADPTDTYLIAYSVPFTYSDCKAHIRQLVNRPQSKDILRVGKLCQTLSGVDCEFLVITNFRDRENLGPIHNITLPGRSNDSQQSGMSARKMKAQMKLNRKALVISARVHPGETPASWMMKGALDFLTSDAPNARIIRQAYVVYVIPMLNPDGVIFGNNRCGLAGVDLNRQWKLPIKSMHPTVYALKALLQEQKNHREISMYIDLHGHSRKYNIFMYGVEEKKRPNPKVRAFPKFFSLHNHGKKYVSYNDCSFHVRKGREATARVVVAKEVGIPLSYTVEATFCGTDDGPLKYCHMHIGHLQEVGSSLCDAFLQYSISEGDVQESALTISRTMRASDIVSSDTLANEVGKSSSSSSLRPSSCSRDGETKDTSGGNGRGYASLKTGGGSEFRSNSRPPSGSDVTVAKESEIDAGDNLTSEDRGVTPIESDSDMVLGDDEDSDGGSVTEDRSSADEFADSKMRGPMLSSRDVKSATTSRSALFSEGRSGRSETAPISPQLSGEGSSSGVRLLARDDGFSFSDSVVANRMIVGIAAKSGSKTMQPQSSFGKSGDQKSSTTVLVAGPPSKAGRSDSVSMRPKKVSRKTTIKGKKAKSRRQRDASADDDSLGVSDGPSASGVFGRRFQMIKSEDEFVVESGGATAGKKLLSTSGQFLVEETTALPRVKKK